MILFFDTFISETSLSPNKFLVDELAKVQANSYTYRPQKKVDIFKYTAASYQVIKWDEVIFRVDGDDIDFSDDIDPYLKALFPDAKVENTRSSTGRQYFDGFKKISGDNPWVFFSPNNDHPFIHYDENIFKKLLGIAEYAEASYQYPVSIIFSHFTEAFNSIFKNGTYYGYTGEWCQVLDEFDDAFVVKYDTLQLLSLQIFRKKFLTDLFDAAGDKRVIRSECLGTYNNIDTPSIVIVPKYELCRHYDGYMHTKFLERRYLTSSLVPPLFIPDGFFDFDVRVRFGYDDYFKGSVNINPMADKYIFEGDGGCDLAIDLEELPVFWKNRISCVDKNPDVKMSANRFSISNYVYNPWPNAGYLDVSLRVFFRRIKFSKFGKMLGFIKRTIRKELYSLRILCFSWLSRSR